ncbi:MAG: hypothetical protein QW279_14485 [Candidatus Jordarchaeaceae archaeon]
MQSPTSSLCLESAIFDNQGNPVKEDLETALILSKASSIVIEDFLKCKKKISTGGLLICLLGIIPLMGIFSTNFLGGVIFLILLSLAICTIGLIIRTGFWIKPARLSYMAKLFWKVWLVSWEEVKQKNFIVYDASKIIKPRSLKFREIPIQQVGQFIEQLSRIPVKEQNWEKERDIRKILEDIANLKNKTKMEERQFYVLSNYSSVLKGFKRLLQMLAHCQAMEASTFNEAVDNTQVLKMAWKKATEEIPYLENIQNVIRIKTDPFIESLQNNMSLITQYWKERSLLAEEWNNINIEKAFSKTVTKIERTINPHINKTEKMYNEKIEVLRHKEDEEIKEMREKYNKTIKEVKMDEQKIEKKLKEEQITLEAMESTLASTPEYLYDTVYDPYTDSYTTKTKRNPDYDILYGKVERVRSNVNGLKRQLDAIRDIISSLNLKMQDEIDNIHRSYSWKIKRVEYLKKKKIDKLRAPIEEIKKVLNSWREVANSLYESILANIELETAVFKDSLDFFTRMQKSLVTWCSSEIDHKKRIIDEMNSFITNIPLETESEAILINIPFWIVEIASKPPTVHIWWPMLYAPPEKREGFVSQSITGYYTTCLQEIAPELNELSLGIRGENEFIETARKVSIFNMTDKMNEAWKAMDRLVELGVISEQFRRLMMEISKGEENV